ncbi:MAG: hypothetical protein FJY85_16540, partial [Deltaproteobacteria bacterium]|nr:hypothetical protein [Deltaproteobacteria bacterium]
VLDQVFDFNVYVSSKRDYRSPTRGAQGNALKTIIGICHLNGYRLIFHTGGQAISYGINDLKLQSGLVMFDKEVSPSQRQHGVEVTGIDATEHTSLVWTYYLANPDVTVKVSDQIFPAVIVPVKRTEKTFIHWYDLKAFASLLQKIHEKDPQRTVKAFCSTFSGTQRILSRLDFSYKRLGEFDSNEDAIEDLYSRLKSLTDPPRANILDKLATGKEALLQIYGANEEACRYKRIRGTYRNGEAEIPYLIEGFLFQSKDGGSGPEIFTSVNGSIPYDNPPFIFPGYEQGTLAGKELWAGSLQGTLDLSGFMRAEGVALYLNFICPVLSFVDKAKTRIDASKFASDLIKVTDFCCKEAIKEVARADRERRQQDRARSVTKRVKNDPKKELMERYFMQGYERASGGYTVTIRQVFYVVRELVNREHGVDLNKGDYNTFTQVTATGFFDRDPELENKIF